MTIIDGPSWDQAIGGFSAPSQLYQDSGRTQELTEQYFTQSVANRERQRKQSRGYNVAEHVFGWYGGTSINILDDLWGNRLNPMGEKGDIWNLAETYGGQAGQRLKEYYEDNQGVVDTSAGFIEAAGIGYMVGAVGVPFVAGKLAASTMLTQTRLWQAGAAYNAATRSAVVAKNLSTANLQGYATAWNSYAHARLLGQTIAKGAAYGAAEEAAIMTFANANDLIFDPEDIGNSIFWAGVGVSIGGIGGALRGRRLLRGLAGEQNVIDARAAAQDRTGLTRNSEGEILPGAIRNPVQNPAARVTRDAIAAHHALPTNPELATRASAEVTGHLANLNQGLVKLGMDPDQAKHWATHVTKQDPLVLHGMRDIEPKNGAGAVKNADAAVEMAKKKPPVTLVEKAIVARAKRIQTTGAAYLDSGWAPLASNPELKALVMADVPPIPEVKMRSPGLTEEVRVTTTKGTTVDLSIAHPPMNFNQLDVSERIQIGLGYKAMFNALKGLKIKLPVKAPGLAHWIEYDAARSFAREGGEVGLNPILAQYGVQTADDLELASLRLKAQEILANPNSLRTTEDFIKYNLPIPTYMERVGPELGDTFKSVLKASLDPAATLDSLKVLHRQLKQIGGYELVKSNIEETLTGNLLNFNRDAKGNWIKPVVASFETASMTQQNNILDAVTRDLVETRMSMLASLMTEPNSIVGSHTKALFNSREFQISSNVHGIANNMSTGVGNAVKQAIGETRTSEFRHRDNPVLLALIRVKEKGAQLTNRALMMLMEKHMAGAHERLIGGSAQASRTLLHQFHTYSVGWDIEDVAQQVAGHNGKTHYSFPLAQTQGNADRLGLSEAKEVVGYELKNPRTNELILLDEVGHEFQVRFNNMSTELLKEQNILRDAQGLRLLNHRNWYVPPPDLTGKHVGFMFDAAGNPIPNRGIIASTAEEYKRLKEALDAEIATTHPGARIMSRDQIAAYKDIFDDAALDWIDPRLIVAPAMRQTGGLGTEFMASNTIQEMMSWTRRQVESIGNTTERLMFDDQIRSANLRHQVETLASGKKYEARTVYQEYEAIARGIPLSTLQNSISGSVARGLTETGDRLLSAVWPHMLNLRSRQAARVFHSLTQAMGVPSGVASRMAHNMSTYDKLAAELGPYSPYKHFEDYLTQTGGYTPPPEIKKITQQLSTFSAAMLLRLVDVSQAAMNLMGLMSTMPAITRSGRAPISLHPITTATQKSVPVLDTALILSGAVVDMMHPKSKIHWDKMHANGDASQAVAEFHHVTSLLTDRNAFMRVMVGSGTAQGKSGVKGLYNRGGITGLLSVATDKTENWSRAYAHFVGLKLASYHGITDIDEMHDFAREIANSGIANYSVVNRPEMYQSPLGSQFGLFTSWARAYNQRLFRWLEDADYMRVAEQFAIQTAMFGETRNVGHGAMSALFQKAMGERDSEGNEVPTLTDRIYARLGPTVGAAVANGAIGSVTGLAFWNRGDVNTRAPSLNPLENIPVLHILGQLGNIGLDLAKYGANGDVIAESIGRNFPNRAIRGAWNQAVNGGVEVDATGRTISESKTLTDMLAGYAGIRSARQQQEVELYYANSAAIRNDALRMENLRIRTRSAIRKGGIDSVDAMDVFDEYLKVGGNPANFRAWITSQVRETSSTREARQFQKTLSNPTNQLRVWRHDAYLGGYGE